MCRATPRISTRSRWPWPQPDPLGQEVVPITRRRLDAELVSRGLATSRERARELVEAGRVTVGGAPALKPARQVSAAEPIVVAGPPARFVGRGGEKLDAALTAFAIDVAGRTALDAGSSTGGFTDCLRQRGAAHVVAVDVGTNQLHERLRADPLVSDLEQTDIRAIGADDLRTAIGSPTVDVVVADLSFISTTGLLPVLGALVSDRGDLVILVKPQFEAGRQEASRARGVIRDPEVWERVLHELIDRAHEAGLDVVDLTISPVLGGKGNVEFLAHLRHGDILA